MLADLLSFHRLLQADSVIDETRAVISLLFLRRENSVRCFQRLLDPRKFYQFRNDKVKKACLECKINTNLREFKYYRPHLAYLHQQMLSWKPRTFTELFIPGYSDRLGWYTAIFGISFGILGILSVFTSIIQMGVAIVALQVTQEQLRLQIVQIANSTGT